MGTSNSLRKFRLERVFIVKKPSEPLPICEAAPSHQANGHTDRKPPHFLENVLQNYIFTNYKEKKLDGLSHKI